MKWIVTGAAGFIGSNASASFLSAGDEVVAVDNLSRPGARQNLAWLFDQPVPPLFVEVDVTDAAAIARVVEEHGDAGAVLHLAGQVAVTTSVRHPRADFESNALGTLNVCEAVRHHAPEALLLNASTNKVYGSGSDDLVLKDGRWSDPASPGGADELTPLGFHSPYACSKGIADQYVLDYARTYGLRTVSLRQSCIYGPRQFGIEDQGWLAWFTVAALAAIPITIFGDGRQARDALEVSDLIDLYARCAADPDRVAGRAINVGGGPENVLSLLELVEMLEQRLDCAVGLRFEQARLGDQRLFVSNIGLARSLLGWEPTVSVESGVVRLVSWIQENLDDVARALGPQKVPRPAATGS
ncbi:MAG TPA: NAD-dependent epimerase/dehydratase family protein [Gaiellaceae bacterium]|jgi:CDP-paratose 2-epimerase